MLVALPFSKAVVSIFSGVLIALSILQLAFGVRPKMVRGMALLYHHRDIGIFLHKYFFIGRQNRSHQAVSLLALLVDHSTGACNIPGALAK